MTEPATLRAINTLVAVGKPSQGDRPPPHLCMTWTVDPVSGKLVARWAAKQAEAAATVRLSAAA
jgi:hypothetical protein